MLYLPSLGNKTVTALGVTADGCVAVALAAYGYSTVAFFDAARAEGPVVPWITQIDRRKSLLFGDPNFMALVCGTVDSNMMFAADQAGVVSVVDMRLRGAMGLSVGK